MIAGSDGTFPIGAVLALLAAISWGGGDFSGGMGVKAAGGSTRGALRVIVSAHTLSLAGLALASCFVHGPAWHTGPVLWGLFAGVVAGLSLAAFYVSLARGEMGSSAAVSGLLAAAIPAAVGMVLEGRPGTLRLVGFGLAAVAIWFIAAPAPGAAGTSGESGTMPLAIAGGVGFGVYFTALKLANPLGVLGPLITARAGSVVICLLLLLLTGRRAGNAMPSPGWLNRSGWLWALGVAVLDSGGNLFYIGSTRAGRLDVAAVLASLYPATTILLAAALLRERPAGRQLMGMGIAVAAVVLVTL